MNFETMIFENRIEKILKNKGLYSEDNLTYLITRIGNQNQTDEELENKIVKVLYEKTKNEFNKQIDGEVFSDEEFEEIKNILEHRTTNNTPQQTKDSFEDIKNFANKPEKIQKSRRNFVEKSMYQEQKHERIKEKLQEKGEIFLKHTSVFAFLSIIYAFLDPVGLRTGITESFFKILMKSYMEMNLLYGGVEIALFLKKIWGPLPKEEDYYMRR